MPAFSFMIPRAAAFLLGVAAGLACPGLLRADPIGNISPSGAGTEIRRSGKVIPAPVAAEVEMLDVIQTARGTAKVRFLDNTELSIGEQSSVELDRFVYDPNSGANSGKLGLRVAVGTARFVTGQIGKMQPKDVTIKTPTATVGIRGTDFSMTVDEIGRTLVILLPTCPDGYASVERDCKVGSIEVITDETSVVLTKAFEATLVSSREASPSAPVILNLNDTGVSNLLIVAPPAEVRALNGEASKSSKDAFFNDASLLGNALDGTNPLEVNQLGRDLLSTEGLLNNALDDAQRQLEAEVSASADVAGIVRGIALGSGIVASITADSLNIVKVAAETRIGLAIPAAGKATVTLNQGGSSVTMTVNGGDGNNITINQ